MFLVRELGVGRTGQEVLLKGRSGHRGGEGCSDNRGFDEVDKNNI